MDKSSRLARVTIELQNEDGFTTLPTQDDIHTWATLAYQGSEHTSLSIRIVDSAEGTQLNHNYREKNYATNVLSFPYEAPLIPEGAEAEDHYLGDLVLCEPVVRSEAEEQGKTLKQHWAHLITHGVLHLQGYDHITEEQADVMETLEIQLLEKLGFENPYIKQ